jgi:hypothetical protein
MKKFAIFKYFTGGFMTLILAEKLDSKNSVSNKSQEFDTKIQEKINNPTPITNSYPVPISKIFQAEKFILRDQFKNNYHISIPFNRKVKYIYNLDNFYYMDYENYNFNKLSDLFLNIHIFIN